MSTRKLDSKRLDLSLHAGRPNHLGNIDTNDAGALNSFTIPPGGVLEVQCESDCYFSLGDSSVTTDATTGLFLAARFSRKLVLGPNDTHIAVLAPSVAAPATSPFKVYSLDVG